MKKIIFGIFAHPDDEAFGPSGALLFETKRGAELHLMTLTLGEAGANPDGHEDLASVREQEWRTAGALIGAHGMHYLGYQDGKLCNYSLIEAGEKLAHLVRSVLSDQPEKCEVEFVTMDLNGITGHIDHIVAARAACWAFYSLKQHDSRFTRIRLACLPEQWLPESNIQWLYMEAGHPKDDIDEIVDARQYHDELITIMRTHHSQRNDGETHINTRGDSIGLDYFLVKT